MIENKLSVVSADNASIYTLAYEPENDPKGLLIICHGFGEYTQSYRDFIEVLTKNGYICVIHDQRGHGQMHGVPRDKRSKLLGIIPGYESFLNDIDAIMAVVKERYPKAPVFLFGHSMGGNIAINYLLNRKQDGFAGAIFETPWLRLFKPMPAPIVALAKLLGKISPRFAITNKLSLKDITRDEQKQREMAADAFYHNHISFRLFSSITEAGEAAIRNIQNLKIPALLICAEQDKIVCPAAIKECKSNAKENVELVVYADAYHAVHNDIIRDDYVHVILEFLHKHGGQET